ncbi:hypothetical protein ACHAXH_003143 [Discostella pseudostelligera]
MSLALPFRQSVSMMARSIAIANTTLQRRTAALRGGTAQLNIHRYTIRPQNQYTNAWLQTLRLLSSKSTIMMTFIDPSGEENAAEAEIGKHLLDVAHDNNIELEGACGGELACSTCHLVFDKEVYDTLPPKTDEEEDMLDLAFELTETSRLGCQIRVTEEFEGIKVRIPDDGY